MRKTTVYLDENSYRSLKRLARERREPEAVLIREALAQYVRAAPRPRLRSLGVGQGAASLAERTDELLAEGFGKTDR